MADETTTTATAEPSLAAAVPTETGTDNAASTTTTNTATIATETVETETSETTETKSEGETKADTDKFNLDTLKLPEHFDKDAAPSKAFLETAVELGLSNTQIESILDKVVPLMIEKELKPYQVWQKTQTKWKDEVTSDPEIGGPNLKKTQVTIAKVIDSFPQAKELRIALDYTGAGNNPAVIRFLHHVGSKLVETSQHVGGSATAVAGNDPKKLYPNSDHR